MEPERLFKILTGTGIGLLLVSFILPTAVGGRRAYTDEDAAEYQQASAELHAALHAAAHETGDEANDGEHEAHAAGSLEAAQSRFDAAQTRRDEAAARGATTAMIVKYLGVLCVAGGIVSYLAMRRKQG